MYLSEENGAKSFQGFKPYALVCMLCICAANELVYIYIYKEKLALRIQQHIPAKIGCNHSSSDSSITKHLKMSRACIPSEPASRFRVLAQARHRSHLDILEALFIQKLSPSLANRKRWLGTYSWFNSRLLWPTCDRKAPLNACGLTFHQLFT